MKSKGLFLQCLLFMVMTLIFLYSFNVSGPDFFKKFQQDSEELVEGAIIVSGYGIDKKLGLIVLEDDELSKYKPGDSLDSLSLEEKEKPLGYYVYDSQYGLQGYFFSFIAKLYPDNFFILHVVTSMALSLVLTLMYKELLSISRSFANSFLFATALSPWLVAFARNLYWVPFTWYLPALFSLYLLKNLDNNKKYLYSFFIFVSFCVKCLCGYEYMSSLVLLAALPFAFVLLTNPVHAKLIYVKNFFLVCILGVLGFAVAVLLHSFAVAGSITKGLDLIWISALKKTIGDPSLAPVIDILLQKALSSSFLDIIYIYTFNWTTYIFGHIGFLNCISVLAMPLMLMAAEKFFYKRLSILNDLLLYIYGLAVPFSWFILAKAHSYIHTHMNYVLWYLGCFPIMVYLAYKYYKANDFLQRLTQHFIDIFKRLYARVRV